MILRVDKDVDAVYFRLDSSPIIESEEVQPGVILDFNEHGEMVGIEILNVSQRVTDPQQLTMLQFETIPV